MNKCNNKKSMKSNYVHVTFVIDESGSMTGTESDVIGGFKKVVDEQRENKEGSCSVSYYKFNGKVDEVYVGKNVKDVEYIDNKYNPNGMTALFDGVGVAIDNTGKWLSAMNEEDRPEKVLVVVMTDGGENSSVEYSAARVREMIKEQEDKYNWSFVYMGSDLTNAQDANNLGITTRAFAKKSAYLGNYDMINASVKAYRCSIGSAKEKNLAFTTSLSESCENATREYANENNLNADDLLS